MAAHDRRTAPFEDLTVLRALALADGVILTAILYAVARDKLVIAATIAPTHGVLFLLQSLMLLLGASRAWLTPRFVVAALLLGPVATVPGLFRRRGGSGA